MPKLNEKQLKKQRAAIRAAISIAGTQTILAELMDKKTTDNVSGYNISNYLVRGMAPDKSLLMHWVTGVSLYDLHPIAYPRRWIKSLRVEK